MDDENPHVKDFFCRTLFHFRALVILLLKCSSYLFSIIFYFTVIIPIVYTAHDTRRNKRYDVITLFHKRSLCIRSNNPSNKHDFTTVTHLPEYCDCAASILTSLNAIGDKYHGSILTSW